MIDPRVRRLGLSVAADMIDSALDKQANIVNPTVYDPLKKKYNSKLTTGMPAESASAPMPKVLPPV